MKEVQNELDNINELKKELRSKLWLIEKSQLVFESEEYITIMWLDNVLRVSLLSKTIILVLENRVDACTDSI